MAKQTPLEKMRQAASDILADPTEQAKREARKHAMQTNFNLYRGSHMNHDKEGIQITDFINGPVYYDPNGGQYFWIRKPKDGAQMLMEMRGWGAIQNLPAFKDTDGNIDMKAAGQFQDDVGKWIAEAINEKLAREKEEGEIKSAQEILMVHHRHNHEELGITWNSALAAMEEYRKQGRYYTVGEIQGIQEQAYQEGINAQLT